MTHATHEVTNQVPPLSGHDVAADPPLHRDGAGWAEAEVLALQGSPLVRFGHPAVADAFCASRLAGDRGIAFGTLPRGVDTGAIIERGLPKP